jgi:hypothetical protein
LEKAKKDLQYHENECQDLSIKTISYKLNLHTKQFFHIKAIEWIKIALSYKVRALVNLAFKHRQFKKIDLSIWFEYLL